MAVSQKASFGNDRAVGYASALKLFLYQASPVTLFSFRRKIKFLSFTFKAATTGLPKIYTLMIMAVFDVTKSAGRNQTSRSIPIKGNTGTSKGGEQANTKKPNPM